MYGVNFVEWIYQSFSLLRSLYCQIRLMIRLSKKTLMDVRLFGGLAVNMRRRIAARACAIINYYR